MNHVLVQCATKEVKSKESDDSILPKSINVLLDRKEENAMTIEQYLLRLPDHLPKLTILKRFFEEKDNQSDGCFSLKIFLG